jgi:hypothetical protein
MLSEKEKQECEIGFMCDGDKDCKGTPGCPYNNNEDSLNELKDTTN